MAALQSRTGAALGFSSADKAGRVVAFARAPAPARQPRALTVRALKAPEGVSQPPLKPSVPPPKFGWVDNAERMNSRAAMIGFFALIAVEFIAQRPFMEMIGVQVGRGLPFEF